MLSIINTLLIPEYTICNKICEILRNTKSEVSQEKKQTKKKQLCYSINKKIKKIKAPFVLYSKSHAFLIVYKVGQMITGGCRFEHSRRVTTSEKKKKEV